MGKKRDTFIAAFEADLGQILNAKKKYDLAKKGPFDGQEQRFNGRGDWRGGAFFERNHFGFFYFSQKKGSTSPVASTIKSLFLSVNWSLFGKIILFFAVFYLLRFRIQRGDKSI